jgi:hypothetical protein
VLELEAGREGASRAREVYAYEKTGPEILDFGGPFSEFIVHLLTFPAKPFVSV